MVCKKGDRLAPTLFNVALEYVMRQLLVEVSFTTSYKSMQLVDYAGDVSIIERTKRAVSEVYEETKERAQGKGLNIKVEKKV